MTSEMELVVGCDGGVRCIYDEALDLREIGKLQITRASHVEPDRDGFWWADMGPVDGPVLGPFRSRTEALQAERGWLVCRDIPRPMPTDNRANPAMPCPSSVANGMPSRALRLRSLPWPSVASVDA